MEALLRVENIAKRYPSRGAFGAAGETTALAGASLEIFPRTTMALVGASGSGKSTLALCVAGLEQVSSGKIWFAGREITALGERELRAVRPAMQMVFQDPASSLNPRMSALELVGEPLQVQKRFVKRERVERAGDLLERVGILREKFTERAGNFSGGQRQRIAIARALALKPRLLILDEALSALDCSVQAQLVNLLLELQESLGLTYLFITHDLTMAAHFADEIAVMSGGRIVETGAVEPILREPRHSATQQMLAAAMRTPVSDDAGELVATTERLG